MSQSLEVMLVSVVRNELRMGLELTYLTLYYMNLYNNLNFIALLKQLCDYL